jgi:DNA-binding LytR/AlgR family response regulator
LVVKKAIAKNMKYNCIIVDDEELAQAILVRFITAVESLALVAKCSNALEALHVLHSRPVDIVFVDIKMPELNGLDLIKSLTNPPSIIITTAYAQYALMGFELSVTDYLLKPFSFERFLRAVNKVIDYRKSLAVSNPALNQHEPDFIFVQIGKVMHKFNLDEIMYLEGCGNYIKLYNSQGMTLLHKTLTYFVNILPENQFIRIHKSYIVALRSIDRVESNAIVIGDKLLPISNLYKTNVLLQIKEWIACRQKM